VLARLVEALRALGHSLIEKDRMVEQGQGLIGMVE
jgi:hypothetical protein